MKKFAVALIVGGIALIGFAPSAMATKPDEDGFHKVTICHNVGHNGHAISVDVAATGITDLKGGHGVITFDENGEFVSFVPHDGNGGHDLDFYLHKGAENKPEDDDACKPVTTTTTTEPPVVTTTTTAPPVTTTTEPPVVTTTTEPPVVTTTTEPVRTAPEPVVPLPCSDTDENPLTGPCTAGGEPIDALPHTGSPAALLASIGAGLAMIGSGMKMLAKKAVA